MKIKFQKRIKKTFAVLAAVMLAVCSMAFSVSADEVLYNSNVTYNTSPISGAFTSSPVVLEVGKTYQISSEYGTFSGVAENDTLGGMDIIAVGVLPSGLFIYSPDLGVSGVSYGSADFETLSPGDTFNLTVTLVTAGSTEDQVVFQGNYPFEKISGDYSLIADSNMQLIAGREYVVEINGIKRQYIAEQKDISGDSGIVLGPVPNVDGEISVTTTNIQGTPAVIINADNLLSAEGTYPVKITLLGIKPPSFLGSVTNAIGSVLSWVGIPINEMLNDGGALVALLPLFGIGISIAAIFVGIKLIRSFTWGN